MLVDKLELDSLLVTKGSEGMTLIEMNGSSSHIDAITEDVVDVTGAGDTVVSVIAASLGSGMSIKESAILANTAAGGVIKKFGTSIVEASDFISQ